MTVSWPAIRRTAVAVAVMLAAMCVLWWVLWTVAAAQCRNVVDAWIMDERSAGRKVEYDERRTEGFPRHVTLRFINMRWESTDGVKMHAGEALISAIPWQWRIFNAKFKKGLEASVAFGDANDTLRLTGDEAHGRVELNESGGQWLLADLRLDNVKATKADGALFTADELQGAIERPEEPPQDHTQPGLEFTGGATNVTLPPDSPSPFGALLPKIDVALRVMGPVPDPRQKKSMEDWNNGSGVVECDNLSLEWGPLTLAARGTIGFDDDLQPEGAFSGHIGGHQEVLKALMEHDFIEKRQEGMLNSALNLFAKPSKLTGKSGVEVPITVQLGGLFLGPVRIFTFPEIEWTE